MGSVLSFQQCLRWWNMNSFRSLINEMFFSVGWGKWKSRVVPRTKTSNIPTYVKFSMKLREGKQFTKRDCKYKSVIVAIYLFEIK